ncbi:MAG: DUF3134 family protein [Cyanobacteria bacterium CRU_2_1]|nr:DUF3134 family protein [Cyanobacteria bacterium RU_5_0]NJR60398.1 DUF3134 family protein [Cyanobacteria bacterium CRU_2_1]
MDSIRNPALHEQPLKQLAPIIPLQRDASILAWLESTGRLLAREPADYDFLSDNEEELNDLMAGDDNSFDADDDDDDALDLDD